MFLLLLLGICFLLLYIYNRAIRDHVMADKMFPGPRRLPLLGNTLDLIATPEDLYRKCLDFGSHYNYQTIRVWIFHELKILVQDCDTVQAVLSSNKLLKKADDYRFVRPWLGDSVFTAEGHKWKSNRKLITPAFHFKILQAFQDVFYQNSLILRSKLLEHDSQKTFDVHEYNILYALDNICDTAMGTSVQAQKYPDSDYVTSMKNLLDIVFQRLTKPWYRLDFVFNLSSLSRLQSRSLKVVHKFTSDVIKERKEERRKYSQNPKVNEDQDLEIKKRNVFLDVLMDAAEEGNWSELDLRSEVDNILFAGHDTVACTLDYIYYNLSQHQDVQGKLCEELRSILANEERCPTYQELQSMKYMDRVIKESARMHPIVLIMGRYVEENFPLANGKFIPKGVDVGINVHALNYNPDIYENPSIFDPDRWTPEKMKKRHPFSYVPFSAGPRNCIGQKFAMTEMKITISSLLRKVQFLPCEAEKRPRLRGGVILTSSNGVNVKVKLRSTPYGV